MMKFIFQLAIEILFTLPALAQTNRLEFAPAPMPNRSVSNPENFLPDHTEIKPGLFRRSSEFAGHGYSLGSTSQEQVDQRAKPGAGVKLSVPLSPNWLGGDSKQK